jgi:hypothetical protein
MIGMPRPSALSKCALFLTLATAPMTLHAARSVIIEGTERFSPTEIALIAGSGSFSDASAAIRDFYVSRGFSLVRVYLIRDDESTLHLFIDEGKLGQIIITGVDTISTIRLKSAFRLQGRIFNITDVEAESHRIAEKYGYRNLIWRLEETPDYDRSFIQINGTLRLPLLGERRIPFFDRYGYRHRLIIEPEHDRTAIRFRSVQLRYGIRYVFWKGIIPEAEISVPGVFGESDAFEAEFESGFDYLGKLNPTRKPGWLYNKATARYHLPDFAGSRFTPRISASALHTGESRRDAGVLSGRFILAEELLEPGIRILDRLRFYTGIGCEHISFYSMRLDPEQDPPSIEDRAWAIFRVSVELSAPGLGLEMDAIPALRCTWTWYRDGENFNQGTLASGGRLELPGLTFLEAGARWTVLNGEVPYFHEISVGGGGFRGFSGRGWHSRNIAKLSTSIRTSLYRDYLFFGLFLDGVHFEGSGRDLDGYYSGIAAGITAQLLFWDQFAGEISWGRDRLFSTGVTGENMTFSIKRVW